MKAKSACERDNSTRQTGLSGLFFFVRCFFQVFLACRRFARHEKGIPRTTSHHHCSMTTIQYEKCAQARPIDSKLGGSIKTERDRCRTNSQEQKDTRFRMKRLLSLVVVSGAEEESHSAYCTPCELFAEKKIIFSLTQ